MDYNLKINSKQNSFERQLRQRFNDGFDLIQVILGPRQVGKTTAILNLLKDLQEKLGLTYVFISHDLSVIEYFCDRVAVMYLGKIVEIGSREEIFNNPKHPYTQALLSAIPRVGEGKKQMKKSLSGEVPSPINPPSGCTFHPRCQFCMPECSQKTPTLVGSPKQMAACWLYDNQLNLIKK